VPAERAGIRCGESGQLDGRQRKKEGEKVEEDMGGLGEKRKRVGPDTASYLGHQRQGSQKNGVFEPAGNAFIQM